MSILSVRKQVGKKDREVLFWFYIRYFHFIEGRNKIIPQFSVSEAFVNFTTSKPCDFL